MPGEITHWVEGSVRPKVWALTIGSAIEDLTGTTVQLQVTDRTGAVVDLSARVALETPAAGTVRVSLQAADLVASKSPYRATFIVTKAGVPQAFPEPDPLLWHVRAW